MLQTVEITGYKDGKEYALKQARAIRNELASGDAHGADKPGTKASAVNLDGIDHLDEKEESVDEHEALALQNQGKGKGIKGRCWNCGEQGHRAEDCPNMAKGVNQMGA